MIKIEKIPAAQWLDLYSELAHLAVFKKSKPAKFDRIDFALMTSEDDKIQAYVTCREADHETLYWQFGGAFAGAQVSLNVYRSFQAMLSVCRTTHKRVTFLVENTNLPMLRLAMKAGFRIIGIRAYKNSILLEHLLEFEDE